VPRAPDRGAEGYAKGRKRCWPGEGRSVTDVIAERPYRPGHDEGWDDGGISDDELTALALAAEPDAPLDDNAVALSLYPEEQAGPLPSWYMPPVMAVCTGRWRKATIFAIIASFLVVDAFGMCITFGQLVAA
jgi:hypothetical protein